MGTTRGVPGVEFAVGGGQAQAGHWSFSCSSTESGSIILRYELFEQAPEPAYRPSVGRALGDSFARMNVVRAGSPEELALARALFEEYASWLGIDLSFQGFAAELAGLPGPYAPPRGRLLLALIEGRAAGCVALRPLEAEVCELKRLFVRPDYRGRGVGKLLTEKILQEAQGIGYRSMRLDTLPSMQNAIRLYEALGFKRRAGYYSTPLADTVFMELKL